MGGDAMGHYLYLTCRSLHTTTGATTSAAGATGLLHRLRHKELPATPPTKNAPNPSKCYLSLLRIEKRFNSVISLPAEAGVAWLPARTSLVVSRLPYSSLLASSSGRRVAPFSEIPANRPLARDHARISAVI